MSIVYDKQQLTCVVLFSCGCAVSVRSTITPSVCLVRRSVLVGPTVLVGSAITAADVSAVETTVLQTLTATPPALQTLLRMSVAPPTQLALTNRTPISSVQLATSFLVKVWDHVILFVRYLSLPYQEIIAQSVLFVTLTATMILRYPLI